MSEDSTQAVEVFVDEAGRQYTIETFALKSNEIGERYRGGTGIPFRLPAQGESVERTISNLSAFVHADADLNTVLAAKINGQGVRLDVQKAIKDVLAHGNEANMARPIEDVLADARTLGESFRLGTPRTRKAGEKAVGKLRTAESQRDKAVNVTLDMYRKLSRTMRAQYGPTLVAQGLPGVTEEALAAIDAEA